MKTRLTGLMVLAAAALISCEDTLGVEMSDYTPLPHFEQMDLSKLTPSANTRYWELRFSWGPYEDRDTVIASGGPVARAQLEPATIATLDTISPHSGFAIGCLPAFCFKYIVAVQGTDVIAYKTAAELETFLGTIDNLEEAALLVNGRRFYWDFGQETGFRVVSDGWEFVVLELVKDCAPVQTDRVHLLVQRNGNVRELGREVHEKLVNACV
jgi:hypothetical protein